MIPASELARMQSDVAFIFKDTATIERDMGTGLSPTGGQANPSWQTVGTSPCNVVDYRVKADETLFASQLVGREPKTVLMPASTIVKVNDRLVINGTTYHVVDAVDPITYEVIRRVHVVRKSEEQ